MGTLTFKSETSIVEKKGFGSQTWSVSFNVSFEGLDGDDAVTKALDNDPTANRLSYNENWESAGSWNPNNRTLSIGSGRRWLDDTERGSTTIYEVGHSWGLPHENKMPGSPIYEQDIKSGNGIMSYGANRSIKNHEVQYGTNRILNTARLQVVRI